VIGRIVPNSSFRPCVFPQNLSASYRRSDGLLPPQKPRPSLQPRGLVQVGASCSLGISGPLRLSFREFPPKGPLHPWGSLSPLDPRGLSTSRIPGHRGVSLSRPGISLVRAPACLAFPTPVNSTSSNPVSPRPIFSARESQASYEAQHFLS